MRGKRPSPKKGQPSFSGKLPIVPPRKPKNADVRPREYLIENEVERLIDAAAALGRHGHRDATMILLAYRHGLRVSELIALRWDMVDLEGGLVHVIRLKHGVNAPHPLRGAEIRALRRVKRDSPNSPYVFVTERGSTMTDSNFRKMLARAGKEAGFSFLVHPHMLRHATGYKLANDGQDTRAIQHYLGHKNIQHTVRYTALNAKRFVGFWQD
jgi:type 1 fimbriae regulatory protein FimB/type 1 fimbriae regulatory protein FimE